jgi:hypothetical protein
MASAVMTKRGRAHRLAAVLIALNSPRRIQPRTLSWPTRYRLAMSATVRPVSVDATALVIRIADLLSPLAVSLGTITGGERPPQKRQGRTLSVEIVQTLFDLGQCQLLEEGRQVRRSA